MKQQLLRLLAVCTVIFLIASSGNPPNGRTDAPGDGYCTDCHSSASQSGNVVINGVPTDIVPGQTYNISIVSTTMSNSARAGFQMVALHDSGNVNAGTMSNPSTSSTVTNAGARTYHEHQPAQAFGGSNSVTWSVDWTAPTNGPNGPITFYAASVLANGGNGNQGDGVVKTNVSGNYMVAANPPSVSVAVDNNVSCFGGADGMATAAAIDGTPPYQYSWPNGESSATATMLMAGTGEVTVTDDMGQTATAQYTITQPNELAANANVISEISCFGEMNGSVISDPTGGTFPYMYTWSNGETTDQIDDLDAGPYTVTVTDANGCTSIETVDLESPTQVTLMVIATTPPNCAGESNGSATVEASGGTPPYTYSWSGGQSGPTATDLSAGVYVVTATDAMGCTGTIDVIITDPAVLEGTVADIQHVTCQGGDDGAISVTAIGGTPPYAFNWSNGMTGAMIDGLMADTYDCTITDNNGCTVELLDITVNDGYLIAVDLDITNESTEGANDGTITATATGGDGNYTYTWSNNSTGPFIMNLEPNMYTVTVTDGNGCSAVATGEVLATGCDLSVSIVELSGNDCPGDMDGSLGIMTDGVIASVLWSTGATTSTISSLGAGNYSVTVTDTSQCEATATYELMDIDSEPPVLSTTSTCVICDSMPEIILDSVYLASLWTDACSDIASISPSMVTLPCGGNQTVEVMLSATDESGNMATETFQVHLRFDLEVNALFFSIPCEATTTAVTVQVSGGSPTYDIAVSPMINLDSVVAGDYIVTYSDTFGCTAMDSFTVEEAPSSITIDTAIVTHASNGEANGSIEVTVTSMSMVDDVLWTDSLGASVGGNELTLDNIFAGNYNVVVINADGCSDTLSNIFVDNQSSTQNQLSDIGLEVFTWNRILTIKSAQQTPYALDIYSSHGKHVLRHDMATGDQSILLNQLPSGVYVVRIVTPAGDIYGKPILLE